MKPILLTSYVNPDLDGTAGLFAYAELLNHQGRPTEVRIMGKPLDESLYMLKRLGLPVPPILNNAKEFDEIILVDVSELHLLGDSFPAERVVEIIDHRLVNDSEKFPNAKAQIELVGAAATLVVERFVAAKVTPSASAAALLHGAIISNTLNFKGKVVTPRDLRAVEFLAPISGFTVDFWKDLFAAKSAMPGDVLVEKLEGDFAQWNLNGTKLGVGQFEIVGSTVLLKERVSEIVNALRGLKKSLGINYVFLNIVDIELNENIFVVADEAEKPLLEKLLEVRFDGAIARKPGMLLRKQILPFLKKEFGA